MKKITDDAKEIMAKYMIGEPRGNIDRYYSKKNQDRMNNKMRLAQIDMINYHYPTMNRCDQNRALSTLNMIGFDTTGYGLAL